MDGKTKLVKQCMPEGADIDLETLDFDHQEQTSPAFRAKRFLGILTVMLISPGCGGGSGGGGEVHVLTLNF